MSNEHNEDTPRISENRLAALVGFEDDSVPHSSPEKAETEADSSSIDEDYAEDPREVSTARPLWKRPLNKAILVLAGTSVLAFCSYTFLESLSKPFPSRAKTSDSNLQSFPVPKEDETGALKGEVALGDQAEALKNLKKSKQERSPKPQTPKPKAEPKPDIRPERIRVERRDLRPVQTRYEVPRRERILPARPQRVAPALPPAEPKQPSPQAPLVSDPNKQWVALSQIGSWGQTTDMAEAVEEGVEVEEVEDDTVVSLSKSNSKSKSNDSEQVVSETSEVIEEEEAPILQEQPRQTLMAGTTCKGILTQLLVHDGSAKQETEYARPITVVLTEPLLAADGLVALPEQTQVRTEIRSFSEEGIVQLVAVSALLEEQGSVVEVPLPKDTVTIYSSDGTPLIAHRVPEKGRNTNISTLGRFARGALEHAATQGLGSGAEGLLEESVKEGAVAVFGRRREQQSDRRSSTFFLPVGTKVQLSVDRSFALDAFASVSPF